MCINPDDPKNAWLKGKRVLVPLINRSIPVIEDSYVDVEFGTGCLKVTPAHDVNDYMLGEKYNLETIDIFNNDGTLNEHGAMYAGLDRFVVREQIEKDLQAAGLMDKVEPYTNKVGYSERTQVPIEPKLSMQWFLKMQDLAKPALDAVMDDTIKLVPPKFKNTYRGVFPVSFGGGIAFQFFMLLMVVLALQILRMLQEISSVLIATFN